MTLSTRRRKDRDRCSHARVWLNGVEVTSRCFYLDTRRGVVRLYQHDSEGHPYVIPSLDSIATEERRGHVRVRIAK